MIIQFEQDIKESQKEAIINRIKGLKYKPAEVKTQMGEYLIGIGKKNFDIRSIGSMDGIKDIHIVSDDYKLVSKKWKVNATTIDLGDGIVIEDGGFQIMAGPCSIEGEDQIRKTIAHLKENGVSIMRGGVFKPRSSPYAFRGMGIEGLELWYQLAKEAGIKIVTEVMQVSQIEEMDPYVDIYQVGARNTQNFNLLDELGKNTDKPVMIKRGISGTIDELLYSAEYVFSAGNERLLLCERGIRTYEKATRNTMDLNAIAVLKEKTHLPVIADPSHGIGLRDFVEPIALASIMAGADGVIYETHEKPEEAYSDGQQTLNFPESGKLIDRMKKTFELRESF
ncbi:MAG: 3-deoxy-7-phosphoheptulonate synthase [Roseivirga sp.]|uniref:3-deoxy-7-phosphoheptulonate synthase n=1 Tax=Roseivirga sp. TaxID=1964215 RepID=UPI001B25C800|nr:3-deoxy-7-phosphoheptulonate synthase [Roseivirga sp.]MBO6660364.1 3-deoxy-7-phosphoheptulonate synthase [Roseivirga sp.]MBO6761200.1 3-deoxy-7-phosphoheptulonate synthase [Roseivirga sp.]MBO6906899.1 3-deoxy-7-phosphoheptulonate synthase [Roseivirga sp.]